MQEQGENNIGSNMWVTDPWPVKRQRIAYMQQRGPGCFDNHYYLQKNPDLKVIPTALELWDHFVMMGQFEGRSFRSVIEAMLQTLNIKEGLLRAQSMAACL